MKKHMVTAALVLSGSLAHGAVITIDSVERSVAGGFPTLDLDRIESTSFGVFDESLSGTQPSTLSSYSVSQNSTLTPLRFDYSGSAATTQGGLASSSARVIFDIEVDTVFNGNVVLRNAFAEFSQTEISLELRGVSLPGRPLIARTFWDRFGQSPDDTSPGSGFPIEFLTLSPGRYEVRVNHRSSPSSVGSARSDATARFTLDPIPTPSTVACIGLLGLAATRRRR